MGEKNLHNITGEAVAVRYKTKGCLRGSLPVSL